MDHKYGPILRGGIVGFGVRAGRWSSEVYRLEGGVGVCAVVGHHGYGCGEEDGEEGGVGDVASIHPGVVGYVRVGFLEGRGVLLFTLSMVRLFLLFGLFHSNYCSLFLLFM